MRSSKARLAALPCALLLASCQYIVFPEEEAQSAAKSKGWNADVMKVGKTAAGDLRVEFAIRNDTTDWSTIRSVKKPALLVPKKGDEVPCETVSVSTGGHRVAPGFRLRGYVAGKKSDPQLQLISVECKGGQAAPGSQVKIQYGYVTGAYNYYEQDKNLVSAVMELDLDKVQPELTFPIAEKVPGLAIQKADATLTGLNQVVLSLKTVERTAQGLTMAWKTSNSGDYPSYVHIGSPPVLGKDGILYGFYETPDIVSVPITPSKGEAEWSTQVRAPADAKGLYVMLSVETGKARLFANHVLDLSDK